MTPFQKSSQEAASNHSMIFGGSNGINGPGEPPEYSREQYESFLSGSNWAYDFLTKPNVSVRESIQGRLKSQIENYKALEIQFEAIGEQNAEYFRIISSSELKRGGKNE